MAGFDWSKIKGGFHGFEQLATTFVNTEFKSPIGWIPTAKTRDGNRDAYTIIVGYQPYLGSEEQWWMEAKYSNESEKLSRYKLDATIVSAIISGNVSRIVFVTNISIHSKTIVDIRDALEKSTNCKSVSFCTKNTLEYWLFNNKDIYETYFDENTFDQLEMNDLFIIEEIEFYAHSNKYLIFKEPLKVLYTGVRYSGSFNIFSSKNITVTIKVDKNMNNIDILDNEVCNKKKIKLKKGENHLSIDFLIKKEFSIQGQTNIQGILFKINNKTAVIPKFKIEVISISRMDLIIKSQETIFQSINDSLQEFNIKPLNQIEVITGESGIGKTFLLDRIVQTETVKKSDVLYINFSQDSIRNNNMLINIILFILFPYISPELIDKEYLIKLNITKYVSELLIELIDNKEDPDKLESLLKKYSDKRALLPIISSINSRIIILDDFHKLNNSGYDFITNLANEISIGKLPVFLILCGQSDFSKSNEYLNFKKTQIVKEHKYVLRILDLINSIKKNTELPFNIDESMIDSLFKNATSFFIFIQYIRDLAETVESVRDFILAFRSFNSGPTIEQYISSEFERAFYNDYTTKELCNQIYRSLNGLLLETDNDNINFSVNKMLHYNLVKYNHEVRLIPFHDTYFDVYIKHYTSIRSRVLASYSNIYEGMQANLSFNNNASELKIIAHEIIKLNSDEKYFTVIYILEGVFRESENKKLQALLGDVLYYKLYYTYAYASANQGKKVSGISIFENIYSETKYHQDTEVISICTEVISELINSKYESWDFDSAEILISELTSKLNGLIKFGYFDGDIYKSSAYILAQSIKILILSEKGATIAHSEFEYFENKIKNFIFHASFIFRYARTLYVRDTKKALELIESSMELLKYHQITNTKWNYLIDFEYFFLKMILFSERSLLVEVITVHERLKNDFFNDFRKGVYALTNFFYIIDEVDRGNSYLMPDIAIKRELRPRQQIFNYQCVALYELISQNPEKALDELKNAQNVDCALESYLNIINHNIKVIENNKFSLDRVEFYFGETNVDNVFYVDPRSCW